MVSKKQPARRIRRERREFAAEFKIEAVRMTAERRAAAVSLEQENHCLRRESAPLKHEQAFVKRCGVLRERVAMRCAVIARTLIEEILVDVDDTVARIHGIVRWAGDQHSTLSVPKRRTGQHRYRTDANAIQLIRELTEILLDGPIASVLNRLGLRTAKGHGWTSHRVCSVRHHEGIPAHDALRAAQAGWLTMDGAATQLGVSDTVIRTLIDRKILPARQVITHAPWMIRAADLAGDGVVHYVDQVRRGCALPSAENPGQLTLESTTTY